MLNLQELTASQLCMNVLPKFAQQPSLKPNELEFYTDFIIPDYLNNTCIVMQYMGAAVLLFYLISHK